MTTENPVDISLVIACYGDGPHLEAHLCEIERVLDQTRYSYEFIIIDDGSPDNSADAVRQAAEKRDNAQAIIHASNVGRGGTVAEGMRLARGTFVGYLDIDLEVHCRYIPAMILAMENGYDGATGLRVYEIGFNLDTLFRHILSVGYRFLLRMFLHIPYLDTESGYKFFRRDKILPVLERTKDPGWFWDTEIMAYCYQCGLKITEIPVLFIRNQTIPSTVNLLRDSWDYFKKLIRFRNVYRNSPPTK